ncbi:NmrA/HSCARG family protein [Leifsonia poae]|uniref:NmrA/HSCARG family protein n=1 Tax=Leifsonia poae TaxID=110933 RepID=UPI003D66B325
MSDRSEPQHDQPQHDQPQHDQPQDYAPGETIAVVGATGKQGSATARELLAHGARVRALTRDIGSEAAQALVREGAEVVAADLDDLTSVRRAFDGASRVFGMATMAGVGPEGETRHGVAFADAARDAGVGYLVYSSVGGAERHTGIPHFESKRRIEEHIVAIGLPATFVRPVFFMENLLGTSVEGGEVVVRLPVPDGIPLQMVAVRDVARVSAALLLHPDLVGGAVEIAGDELTGSQIADVFGRQAGLPARYEAIPTTGFDADPKAMFDWFAGPSAYQADFEATRALDPQLLDLPAWLAQSGWQPRPQ